MMTHLGVWTLLLEQLNWKGFIKYIKNNWSRSFGGKFSCADTEEIDTKRQSPTEIHIRPYRQVPRYKKTFQRLKGEQAQLCLCCHLGMRGDVLPGSWHELFGLLLFGKTTMCSWPPNASRNQDGVHTWQGPMLPWVHGDCFGGVCPGICVAH